MCAMISRCLIGASLVLLVGPATPIRSTTAIRAPNVERQIEGCTLISGSSKPFSPYVALAYGLRGGAYQKKG